MTHDPLLLQLLQNPDTLDRFNLADWDLLVRQARSAGLLAQLQTLLNNHGLMERVPEQPRKHLAWAHTVAERHTLAVKWEVTLIRKALEQLDVPIILLKGAAYVMAGLPAAQGRIFSDIDILVPKNDLNGVEAALMLHGWATTHHDAYDQHYYRTWMHELPPMQHIRRMALLDVHHAILPETAHLRPDSEKLRSAAITLNGYDKLLTLAPIDMVLHSATHLFHDGELTHGLRDLLDIDSLLHHFSTTPSFWPTLTRRAHELDAALDAVMALKFRNSGQTCVCANRIFVQRGISEHFLRILHPEGARAEDRRRRSARSADRPADHPGGGGAILGRIVTRALAQGAQLLAGGGEPEPDSAFYPPTVLSA